MAAIVDLVLTNLKREPSVAVGLCVFVVATVALIVTGTDTEQALLTALAISGVQAVVTRTQVSPAKKRRRR